MSPVVLDFTIIPPAITEFCDKMNIVLNAIFHPIQTLQGVSYPLCIIGACVSILLGVIGFKNCYKWAGAFILFYLLINLI